MSHTISAVLEESNKVMSHLDSEILLAHVLHSSRSFLYASPETYLTNTQYHIFKELIRRYQEGEPIAYLIGHQEFWSFDFLVTKEVLIPRPDTELLVEIILQRYANTHLTLADLGTGSGAIAISIASERPAWDMHATDQSEGALQIARINAERLKVQNMHFYQGNWCDALPNLLFDVILSNPPYIEECDLHLKKLSHEPLSALVSGKEGLDAIREIIHRAYSHLKPGGLLLLEHGYNQAARVRELFSQAGYHRIFTECDLAGIERVTGASSPFIPLKY